VQLRQWTSLAGRASILESGDEPTVAAGDTRVLCEFGTGGTASGGASAPVHRLSSDGIKTPAAESQHSASITHPRFPPHGPPYCFECTNATRIFSGPAAGLAFAAEKVGFHDSGCARNVVYIAYTNWARCAGGAQSDRAVDGYKSFSLRW